MIPHPYTLAALQNHSHCFGDQEILGEFGLALATVEFERCIGFHHEFGTPQSQLLATPAAIVFGVLAEIQTKEFPLQRKLIHLAESFISDYFGIDGQLKFKSTLSQNIQLQPEHNSTLIDPEHLHEHIHKRILLNALVHGSAIHIWKSFHYLMQEDLDQLSPELLPLYNRFIADSSLLSAATPPIPSKEFFDAAMNSPQTPMLQGQNQIEFQDQPRVEARATCVPTLIHELVKASMDVVVLHGLDPNLTQDQQQYIFQQSDQHHQEQWFYWIGSGLWQKLIQHTQPNSQDIPKLIMDIALMPYPEMVQYFKNIIE